MNGPERVLGMVGAMALLIWLVYSTVVIGRYLSLESRSRGCPYTLWQRIADLEWPILTCLVSLPVTLEACGVSHWFNRLQVALGLAGGLHLINAWLVRQSPAETMVSRLVAGRALQAARRGRGAASRD